MPKEKNIAWKFVIKLKGNKWRCPYCENEYSGQVTRVKSHLLKDSNKGISPCKKVPEHVSMLLGCLPNQVCNKDDIAWKFVNRLEYDKWHCHYCRKEFFGDLTGVKGHLLGVPNEGISICTKVPDHERELMRSLLDEVAEEESREANGQSSMEPQSRDLPTQAEVAEEESREANGQPSVEPQSRDLPTQAEVAEEESREANRQFAMEFLEDMEQSDFNQQDAIGLNSDQQSQSDRRLHQSSTVPLSVQNSHGENVAPSGMTFEELGLFLLDSPYQPQSSIPAPYPEEMQMNNQQTPAGESSFQREECGTENCSFPRQESMDNYPLTAPRIDLQVPEGEANMAGPSSSSQASVSPQHQSVPHQSTNHRNAQPNPTMLLGNQDATWQHNPSNHRLDAREPPALLNQPIHHERGSEQQNPRRLSSFPNDQFHGISKSYWPHGLNGGDVLPNPRHSNIATTSNPQYPNEQFPSFDEQFAGGIPSDTPIFSPDSSYLHPPQSQTPMDIDPPTASQHTSAAHNFEATITDSGVPTVAMDTIGPSSSQGIQRGFSNQEHPNHHTIFCTSAQERTISTSHPPNVEGATHLKTGSERQISSALSSLPNEQYPSPAVQSADGITSDLPATPGSSIFHSLPESHDANVNTCEEIQTNKLHNPTMGSSLQNDSSVDVDGTTCLLDFSQAGVAEVVPVLSNISLNNTVQHPNQLHPRCDKEYGNDARSFASQTPTDIVPSRASEHTTDSHIIKATIVDSQVPEASTNTTGPSSSQDMNRGSPIMNVRSIYANDAEIRNLKRKVEELDDKEADIKEQMEIESGAYSDRKKPRTLVEKWLKKTERARDNFRTIGKAYAETLPPKEQVETLTREVEELVEQTLPRPLLIEARDAKGNAFLERKLMGEEIHRNIELIWNRLKENHGCKLGIYGMGGVGKTTIMMHVHNRLLKDTTFDGVLFITVSQDFSIYKLQSDIWKALKFGIMDDEHEMKRAAMLSEHLERKRNFVLILDDVWQHFKLQDVGIPDRDGLKVVLTTRSSGVCSQMDCEDIKIQPLGEQEAWKLFEEELGPQLLTDKQVEKVARKIANRCAGLPLAINAIANSMRGEKNVFVWQDISNKLERSHTKHTEMGDKVLPVLKLSYKRLSDPQVKQCFVFCALFPEDSSIREKELIEYFIDEGYLDELDTREEQYCRGLAIVDKLRNACLLEVDYYGFLRMHDLMRDMALLIMTTTYMVKGGQGLRTIPNGEHWTEDLEKVSLMWGWIEDIPLDTSPNCPKLSTLLLNHSIRRGLVLQDSFFMNLRGLKVLNLSGCAITKLPDSLSELANLQALLLRDCGSLIRIPYLRKLKCLRKLDANGCRSLLAVEGLEELSNLRYLDLSRTGIERSWEGTFRGMTNLQYLQIAGKVKAQEVIRLKALKRLECNFGNVDDFNEYVRFMERSRHNNHSYELIVDQEKSLWLVTESVYSDPEILPENKIIFEWGYEHYCDHGRAVNIRSCNYAMARVGEERNTDSILIPGDVEFFKVKNWRAMTNLSGMSRLRYLKKLIIKKWDNSVELFFGGTGVDAEETDITQDFPAPLFPSLEMLGIRSCSKLKYLFGHESRFSLPLLREVATDECEGIEGMNSLVASPLQPGGGPAFPRLENITVEKCGNMKRVVGSEWLPHLPSLKSITVRDCNKIRELFPHECLLLLPNLQCIEVEGCKGIEEIISGGGENQGGGPAFPRLENISAGHCRNMKRVVGSEWLPCFPSLKSITVEYCNKIRELFPHECLLHLPNLECIEVEGCKGIEEIISGGGQNQGGSAPLNIPSSSLPSPSVFVSNCLKLKTDSTDPSHPEDDCIDSLDSEDDSTDSLDSADDSSDF